MARLQLDGFGRLMRIPSFRAYWLGFAVSVLGDAMTRVALTWFVYDQTHSARAIGLLSLCYTGPIVAGGLLAGWLLDRFDRRRVMIVDALIRGLAVLAIPLLAATHQLALWHVYGVAVVYGLLLMISLAGGPTIFPSLVPSEQLQAVNAMEILGFTVAGIVGPPAAGLLLGSIGAPNVLLFDACSYGAFALALLRVRLRPATAPPPSVDGRAGHSLVAAFRLLRANPVLRSTTIMFMFFNLGQGCLFVWLPIFSSRTLQGGAGTYGILLGALSAGELVSTLLAGAVTLALPLGTLICLAQGLAGLTLVTLFAGRTGPALAGLVAYGFFSAPLTIWAQTLRMAIIPGHLRGRSFALLRMLMQSGGPAGGLGGGFLIPVLGLPLALLLSALLVGLPGALGYRGTALRGAGRPQVEASQATEPDAEPRAAG